MMLHLRLRKWAMSIALILLAAHTFSAVLHAQETSGQEISRQDNTYTNQTYLPYLFQNETITGTSRLELTNPGSQQNVVGDPVAMVMQLETSAQGPLSFSASGLPEGVTIDPGTGVLTGAPTAAGDYTVSVFVRDSRGSAGSVTFTMTVSDTNPDPGGNADPILQTPADQVALLGDVVTLLISGQDPDGDTLTFSVQNLPNGLQINPENGTIAGTIDAAPEAAGTYKIVLVASDGNGGRAITSFAWRVTAPDNQVPFLANPGAQSSALGDEITLALEASDPDGDALAFSATALPAGLEIDASSGVISGTTAAGGSYVSTVSVDDGRGGAETVTFTWTVTQPNNEPPQLTNPGDQQSMVNSGLRLDIIATDPDQDALTFTAEGLPGGLEIAPNSGIIAGVPESDGTFTVTITASDGNSEPVTATFLWTIMSLQNSPPVIASLGDQQHEVNQPISVTIQVSDPNGDAVTVAVDGLPTGLQFITESLSITGTPTVIDQYDVLISASDDNGGEANAIIQWTITPPPNVPPTIINPGDQRVQVNQPISMTISASDVNSDTITFGASGLPDGLTIAPATGHISGTVSAIGTYTVTISADDGISGADSAEFMWTVIPIPTTIVSITRASSNASTLESTGREVVLRIERSEIGDEMAVNVGMTDTGEPMRAAVSAGDVLIRDEAENEIGDSLIFTPTQAAITITVQAIPDELVEVPEVAYMTIDESEHYVIDESAAKVRFAVRDDRATITENSRLFVAQFGPENGAITSGSGIATVRLADDNSFGNLSLFFTGLTSEETASHIHIQNPTSGPIAFSIPLGQVTDEKWTIQAAHHIPTNQAMLDTLMNGQLYANVHSANYTDGEIRGTLLPAQGSIEMKPVPPPDPIEDLSAPNREGDLDRDISRFLTQATFGPTPATVAALKARIEAHSGDRIAAYSEWITEQLALESPSLSAYREAANGLYMEEFDQEAAGYRVYGLTEGWFTGAVYSKAQLRERATFALSEIFVISLDDGSLRSTPQAIASYYDMLRTDTFGLYKDLLRDISLHPAMGVYLSHLRNQAVRYNGDGEIIAAPDENYAREIMQLFSIGLLQLHPDGTLKLDQNADPQRTYDQTDITELSRVFTGWGLSVRNPDNGETTAIIENTEFFHNGHNRTTAEYQPGFTNPMKMFEDNGREPDAGGYVRYHDNEAKRVLGVDIPAGLSGEEDLQQALDILTNHPNTGPFLSLRLIQRLVTSNPSRGYIYRVATVFEETGGNLGEVLRAILLDPEARNLGLEERVGHGKKKEPLVHFSAMLRLIQARANLVDGETVTTYPVSLLQDYGLSADEVAKYEADANQVIIDWARFGSANSGVTFYQAPLHAPTVFNWFLPDFAPAGAVSGAGLVAPELQIVTENQVIRYYNTFYHLFISQNLSLGRARRVDSFTLLAFDPPPWLVDAYLGVMDTNDDQAITPDDTTFADPEAVRDATLAMVNTLDNYVCSGRLQSQSFRYQVLDPRYIIRDSVYDGLKNFDHSSAANATQAMEERIKEALFMVSTAPECLTER